MQLLAYEPKTWNDYVWEYWPEATTDQCAQILREHTSSLASPSRLLQQLDDYMVNVMNRRRNG